MTERARDEPGGSGWGDTAVAFRGRNGARFLYTCPSYGSPGSVWGTDVYTDDSSVCTAAVHAGRITLAGGGYVTIEIRPGQDSYKGSGRNGITTSDWGRWSGSFVIVSAELPGAGLGVGGVGWSITASSFRQYVGQRFVYTCPANGTPGTVWGSNVYTDDSSVCTAAVHAGRITLAAGGSVTIEMRPGQESYTGSTRNGVTSSGYGSWGGSYVIVGAPVGAGPPTGTSTGTVLVNGQPFTGGVIRYGASVDVTKGSLDMETEVGKLTVTGGAGLTSKFKLVRASTRSGGKNVPVVELRLVGGNFAPCAQRALAAVKKKPIRRLWGNGKGRFRSKGRHSSASVKGTRWLTEDRCDGTLTVVREGVVAVRDLVRKKTITVRAGRSYLAKPRRK